ncbi:beta-lactamase [Xylariaceae sp. FL0016]|nr:beta-lactamase [Xylariaceae sp. FL0016]
MPFSETTLSELRTIVNTAASGDQGGIPGATVVIVDKNGDELFAHSAGKRGMASDEPMSLDSIFWIASCTKLITGIACMQLVERETLSLDDEGQVESLCPELKDIKVLKEDGTLEDKKKSITLRMLLTHTVGFGYTFFVERLRDHFFPTGYDEFDADFKQVLKTPLLFQPGEGWEYGIGPDWAGVIIERVSGMSLNDYMKNHIFEPLGLKNMNMLPTQAMMDNLAYMNFRAADGKLLPRDHPMRRPLLASTKEELAACFQSGGGGLFAKPQEYARILSVVLNNGICPKTGTKLLEKSTVDEMFTNQIPQFPDFGRQPIPAAKGEYTNPIPELYPAEGIPPQGWGITFMLAGGRTGRSDATAWWAGLPNLFWWCDREKGVAGIVCSQILPFLDANVAAMWANVESTVYKGLNV